MILRLVLACLAVAVPTGVSATDKLIRVVNVDPSSASQHQVRVQFRMNEQPACPNVAVYVSVPRDSTGVDVRIADRNGKPIFSGLVGLVTVNLSGSKPNTPSTHPMHQYGGFHGAQLCIQESLLATTKITVDFGPQPYGVTHYLDLGPLSRWMPQ
jgi:hypothetical protein